VSDDDRAEELRSSARALRRLLADPDYQHLVERLNQITDPRQQQAFIEQHMSSSALRRRGIDVPESFSVSMRIFEEPRGSDGRGYVGHTRLPDVFRFFDDEEALGDSTTVCTTICHTAGGTSVGHTHGTTTGTPTIKVVT
jgi:hypothetical protein